jgi:ElaB/YqjD/DUF883 family membrane-anchored ribosome-binding protein
MKQSTKSQPTTPPDIDQVKDDILALTRDLASLIDKMKTVAVDSSGEAVRESVEELGDKARILYEQVAAQGERSAKAVSRQIEAQPILSLLVAFAVGFCVSRLLSR